MRRSSFLILAGCFLGSAASARAAFLPVTIGESARYRLRYQGVGKMDPQGWMKGRAPQRQAIASALEADLQIVQMAPGRFAMRLLSPRYRLMIDRQAADVSRESAALASLCFLSADSAGRVQNVSFAPETPALTRSLMRAVIGGLQFVRSDSGAARWQAQQDTANGAARVAYRRVSPDLCEARIESYPQPRSIGPKGEPVVRHVPGGALRFTFAGSRLQEVTGTRTTSTTMAGRFLSEATERLEVRRLGGEILAPAMRDAWEADRRARADAPAALSAPDRDPAAQRASWQQVLQGATADSLLADLKALEAKGGRNDGALYARLCALFSLQPEASARLAHDLGSAAPSQPALRLTAAALGAVAAAPSYVPGAASAAERALREMLRARQSDADAVMLLAPSVAMTRAPEAATWELLETLSRSANPDIAASATLALGGISRFCPPSIAKALVGRLADRLPTADESLRGPLLAALGNAGSVDGLPALAAYTRDGSALLRGTAYMSLRFLPGAAATALLLRGLKDPDPAVRINAARALEFRPFGAPEVHAVQAALAREEVATVRLTLLENLFLEMPYHPSVRGALERAAAADPAAEIRGAAAGWLRQGK